MSRLAHRFLDAAARRWPAEIRDEMAQEWHAELAAIETEPGGKRRSFAYALSLLLSPPVKDRTGAPRGWAETTGALAPAGALILTGLLTLGVARGADLLTSFLFDLAGLDPYVLAWPSAIANGVLVAVWCLLAGRWLGRRVPLEETARLGPAASAAFAPLLFVPALLIPAVTDSDPLYIAGLLIGLLVWVPGMAALGAAVARGRRGLPSMLIGTPLLGVLGAMAATLPMIVAGPGGPSVGLRAAAASLLNGTVPDEYMVIPEGALSSRGFYFFGPWAITLATFGVLALAFGTAALRPLPQLAPTASPAGDEPAPRPSIVVAVGAAGVALAVIAWAYTVTILSPGMLTVSATAPMPGGDGEIYLWVAELRWSAILMAALAMLIATADRRRALAATLVLAGALVAADGVLVRVHAAGAGGLRLTLLIGAVLVAAAWLVARGPLPGAGVTTVVRRRAGAAAVIAAGCAPLLLTQGTPGVNHPFLPAGLQLTTTGLVVLGMLLAAIPAVTLSRYRVPAWAAVLLIGVPVVAVTVAGFAPVSTESEDTGYGALGALVGLPVAIVVLALLRRHRPRRRGRTAALWTLLTLAGLPATFAILFTGVALTSIVPDLLFAVEGLGYPADGISFVPGAVLLMTPFAALMSARLDGRPGQGEQAAQPWPAPDPLSSGETVPG
ncbi:hypothetical protein [Paractinoplanes durhamensis]|uniref:Integral membrane protein n=1 Tax=Paractinoplanes durhamensis TaxID=113563 RepID=A0ABQ3YUD7_9ACTN|nr:hypothetical protein [Actinoplanes durhamensis]GIE01220.1 hypothetical protein Adu01nite_25700 [Actinoplanes durhamensis]